MATKLVETVLPNILPVLPVRNTVMFPHASVPLVVGRAKSLLAVQEAQKNSDLILIVTQKNGGDEEPVESGVYNLGVVCALDKYQKGDNKSLHFVATGLVPFQINTLNSEGAFLTATGEPLLEEAGPLSVRGQVLVTEIKKTSKSIIELSNPPSGDILISLLDEISEPWPLVYLSCGLLNGPIEKRQELLEMVPGDAKLELILQLLSEEKLRCAVQNEIHTKTMDRFSDDQREQILREQMRTISEELSSDSSGNSALAKKIEDKGLPEQALKTAREELNRLESIHRSSPEYNMVRTFLEWMIELPWNTASISDVQESISIPKARMLLDEDHFGIERVKRHLLQYLSVLKLKQDHRPPILCFIGPPGVGKSSISKSLARALQRKFVRLSLGGVRDEAEIRGHRKTYVGAMPGKILQSLKRCGTHDPVMLLDEIDKLGSDFRGDPSSALLEVLDPEQNKEFMDHYLDVPFDLSKIFFVTTANDLNSIPPALRDRLEIIEMSSYTLQEKREIALRHLVPKELVEHGIKADELKFNNEVLSTLMEEYTRESGVRELRRVIATLCRVCAETIVEGNPPLGVLTIEQVRNLMGPTKYHRTEFQKEIVPGIINGLAWTPYGGEVLRIEATHMEGTGKLILTGQLGDVMKESAQIALTLVRNFLGENFPYALEKRDIHIHLPAGAVPKDGPSAGTALFLVLLSLFQKKPASQELAVTGEISLRGNILPVGGIREKVLAAYRQKLRTVYIPKTNASDLQEIPNEVKSEIRIELVSHVHELVEAFALNVSSQPGTVRPLPFIGSSNLELPLFN